MEGDVNIYPKDCNKQLQENLNIHVLIKDKSCIHCLFTTVKLVKEADLGSFALKLE